MGPVARAGQAGYSLAEVLVVAAIVGLIMAGILGIYQTSQQSYLFASAGEEAQLSSRSALDRLASELRLINTGRDTAGGAITAASATGITFLADVDNDTLTATAADATLSAQANAGATTVQVSSNAGFAVGELLSITDGVIMETRSISAISGTTLTLAAGLGNRYAAGSLVRSVETVTYAMTGGTLTRIVGGSVDTLAAGVSSFQITYWDAATPPVQITDLTTQANRDLIRELRLQIVIRALSGGQSVERSLGTTVRPRNLL